jgi:hypothetical protein
MMRSVTRATVSFSITIPSLSIWAVKDGIARLMLALT